MSPSDVFTPFNRRFTNEHERSLDETRALYDAISSRYRQSIWSRPDAIQITSNAVTKIIQQQMTLPAYEPFLYSLADCQQETLALENAIFASMDRDLSEPISLREQMELNAALREREFFFEHEDEVCDACTDAMHRLAALLIGTLKTPSRSGLTIPLFTVMDDLPQLLDAVITTFLMPKHFELKVFTALNQKLYENLCAASGFKADTEPTKPLIYPSMAKLKGPALIDAYLGGTPLHALFNAPYPFELPVEQRFAGHWCIAPPGRGKTVLLQAMVADDIQRDAAIILMDSKGDLIEPFRNMKSISHRLIIIDPDPERPVAINPLDIPQTQIGKAVELLEYLFASLLEFKLTATQSLLFRNVIRFLVTQFSRPTLDLFREILSDGWSPKYGGPIGRLDPHLKDFFYKDFDNENYTARRREVLQRLQLLLDNDAMRAILSSTFTRFTFDQALDSGKIVIINNSKEKLGDQGAEFFGRFFIAQLLATAQRRSGRPQSQKKPVYCYIDECQNVIARDEKIPTILDECRSQNIALILAHQRTTQIKDENVLSALQNCAIRFANSDSEARKLAHSLRSSEQFLESLERGQFAAYIRDCTKSAVGIGVVKPVFVHEEQLTATEQEQLRDRMMRDYGRVAEKQLPIAAGSTAGSNAHPPKEEPVRLTKRKSGRKADRHVRSTVTTPRDSPIEQASSRPAAADGVGDPGEPSDTW